MKTILYETQLMSLNVTFFAVFALSSSLKCTRLKCSFKHFSFELYLFETNTMLVSIHDRHKAFPWHTELHLWNDRRYSN